MPQYASSISACLAYHAARNRARKQNRARPEAEHASSRNEHAVANGPQGGCVDVDNMHAVIICLLPDLCKKDSVIVFPESEIYVSYRTVALSC